MHQIWIIREREKERSSSAGPLSRQNLEVDHLRVSQGCGTKWVGRWAGEEHITPNKELQLRDLQEWELLDELIKAPQKWSLNIARLRKQRIFYFPCLSNPKPCKSQTELYERGEGKWVRQQSAPPSQAVGSRPQLERGEVARTKNEVGSLGYYMGPRL